MKQSQHFLDHAENCAQLAERAADEPTYNRYKRMEAAWRALAVEQDWLNGEIVQNAKQLSERDSRLIAAATIVYGTYLWLLFRLITRRGHTVVVIRKTQKSSFDQRVCFVRKLPKDARPIPIKSFVPVCPSQKELHARFLRPTLVI